MTSVYIYGPAKAVEAAEWIKNNIKNCDYTLDFNPTNAFQGKYKFDFVSKHDATIVALRWGNEYKL